MRTKLARKYGLGKSVKAYIDLAGKQELSLSDKTLTYAHQIFDVLDSPSSVLAQS